MPLACKSITRDTDWKPNSTKESGTNVFQTNGLDRRGNGKVREVVLIGGKLMMMPPVPSNSKCSQRTGVIPSCAQGKCSAVASSDEKHTSEELWAVGKHAGVEPTSSSP